MERGSNSSNEDLSQYTDADETMSAPTEILAEFLSALMLKDYSSALKFCNIILQYEPNHETAKQFYPLIQEKLSLQQANEKHQLDNQIEEYSSEDDSSTNSDENGNVLDDSDNTSTGSGDQRDAEETTASYSSLEDEVVDSTTLTYSLNKNPLDNDNESPTNSDLTDDNGNNIPSMSTTTTNSDSDSFPECKKVSAKLKSLLPYRRNHRYSKHVPT